MADSTTTSPSSNSCLARTDENATPLSFARTKLAADTMLDT